jgi:hypothetical protein
VARVIERTVYKFDELSDKAKDRARDEARGWDVEDEWWNYTYDDAVRMGALMGIEISSTKYTNKQLNHSWEKVDISFSGFSSQGDGASFAGRYRCVPDAVAQIKAECNDEELVAIAEELTTLQVVAKFDGNRQLACDVAQVSNRFALSVNVYEFDGNNDFLVTSEEEHALGELMRRFAAWIYDQLEAQYEYLTSDEHVNERLSEEDYEFEEDGTII